VDGQEKQIDARNLRRFCLAALVAVGVPGDDAEIVSDSLVEANLRGTDSEGVTHLPGYVKAIQAGEVNPTPQIHVVNETDATAVFDGDRGFGQVAGVKAMRTAVAKGKLHAFGAVGVHNSTHNGALAYYSAIAAAEGLIGFTTSSGARIVPPYGSATPLLDNYFSYGVPTGRADPLLLDTGLTNAPASQLREAISRGESLPAHWAMDKEGKPTEDPDEAADGFPSWMGEYRGYGLALVMETFAGILSGGPARADMPSRSEPYETSRQNHFYAALDPAAYTSFDTYDLRIGHLLDDIVARRPTEGATAVFLLPGEPEALTRPERVRDGIPIGPSLLDELARLRKELKFETSLD
jgi:LDH2 family malate/lactate/ureidoglycolate dehydrogenase